MRLMMLLAAMTCPAAPLVLHLKNGDRLSGHLLSESTNSVTLSTPYLGNISVPLAEIAKREIAPEPPATNTPPKSVGPAPAPVPNAAKTPQPKPPLTPTNPEATPIASTPSLWKHDLRFGLNMRYAAKDSQEILAIAKSTYGKAPFRHILDASFKYGKIEGVVSANSAAGSEKTEYQLSPKTYLFNLVGAGFDEIRHIDAQAEIGPGFGMELLKLTNFVWKGEAGFNFQKQYRSDDTEQTSYSVRIAEIFAWRVWDKLTADLKVEFFPNLGDFGEYRFRIESTLRYPVSNHLSLNLEVIDIYDTLPARDISRNDMQLRSTIGINF